MLSFFRFLKSAIHGLGNNGLGLSDGKNRGCQINTQGSVPFILSQNRQFPHYSRTIITKDRPLAGKKNFKNLHQRNMKEKGGGHYVLCHLL